MARIITINGDDDGEHPDDNHHITATEMIINPTDCIEPCNATVTVTWTNTGNERKKFRPAIKVNGTKIELEEVNIRKNHSITQTFNLTNLIEGVYTICPVPN